MSRWRTRSKLGDYHHWPFMCIDTVIVVVVTKYDDAARESTDEAKVNFWSAPVNTGPVQLVTCRCVCACSWTFLLWIDYGLCTAQVRVWFFSMIGINRCRSNKTFYEEADKSTKSSSKFGENFKWSAFVHQISDHKGNTTVSQQKKGWLGMSDQNN